MTVVFDLDDTLYKESDFVESGLRAVGQYLRATGLHYDIAGRWTTEMLEVYRMHKPTIALSDDARMTLDTLRDNGVDIGIITDGRIATQSNKIAALGLDEYVRPEDIIISEAVGADKTTSAPFEAIMRRHPGESHWIYIGDNPAKDFVHPNRLGWHTVMLIDATGSNIHPQPLPQDIDYRPKEMTSTLYDYISKYIRQLRQC